jgi:hypothetical protein
MGVRNSAIFRIYAQAFSLSAIYSLKNSAENIAMPDWMLIRIRYTRTAADGVRRAANLDSAH